VAPTHRRVARGDPEPDGAVLRVVDDLKVGLVEGHLLARDLNLDGILAQRRSSSVQSIASATSSGRAVTSFGTTRFLKGMR
jgi:hypothetical protein